MLTFPKLNPPACTAATTPRCVIPQGGTPRLLHTRHTLSRPVCVRKITLRVPTRFAALRKPTQSSKLGSYNDVQGGRSIEPVLVCIPDTYPRQNGQGQPRIPGFTLQQTSSAPDACSFQESVSFWKAQVEAAAHGAPHEQPLYMVGEGSGALVAIAVAAQCGLDIDRLVLINPHTAFPTSLLRRILTLPTPFLPLSLPLPLPFPPPPLPLLWRQPTTATTATPRKPADRLHQRPPLLPANSTAPSLKHGSRPTNPAASDAAGPAAAQHSTGNSKSLDGTVNGNKRREMRNFSDAVTHHSRKSTEAAAAAAGGAGADEAGPSPQGGPGGQAAGTRNGGSAPAAVTLLPRFATATEGVAQHGSFLGFGAALGAKSWTGMGIEGEEGSRVGRTEWQVQGLNGVKYGGVGVQSELAGRSQMPSNGRAHGTTQEGVMSLGRVTNTGEGRPRGGGIHARRDVDPEQEAGKQAQTVVAPAETAVAGNSASFSLPAAPAPAPLPFIGPWPPFPLPQSLPPPLVAPQIPGAGLQAATGKLQALLGASADERHQYLQFLDQGVAATENLLPRVSQRTVVIAGAQDVLVDSAKESERLAQVMPRCQAVVLLQYGHNMLSSPRFGLQEQLQAAGFYTSRLQFSSPGAPVALGRAGPVELPSDWDVSWADRKRAGLDLMVRKLCSPVFVSTHEGGRKVEGLEALPGQGPLLVVGNHQLMAPDTPHVIQEVLQEKGLLLRGLGHPALFLDPEVASQQLGFLAQLQGSNAQVFKTFGAVPVTPMALHRLLGAGEALLLYPGGEREIYKRKNEKYKLFWPSRAEFVRTAAKFSATLIPLAAVGVEECVDVLMDSQQLLNTPLLGSVLQQAINRAPKARVGATDVLGFEQLFVPPLVSVSVPARLYFVFQEPIKLGPELYQHKQRCQEVYEQVQASVQAGIEWVQKQQQQDPYRDFLTRILYENPIGAKPRKAPTFKM